MNVRRPLPGILFLLPTLLAAQTIQSNPDQFPWRNIGPATMMGRISAIDALESDYRTVLIGSATPLID